MGCPQRFSGSIHEPDLRTRLLRTWRNDPWYLCVRLRLICYQEYLSSGKPSTTQQFPFLRSTCVVVSAIFYFQLCTLWDLRYEIFSWLLFFLDEALRFAVFIFYLPNPYLTHLFTSYFFLFGRSNGHSQWLWISCDTSLPVICSSDISNGQVTATTYIDFRKRELILEIHRWDKLNIV